MKKILLCLFTLFVSGNICAQKLKRPFQNDVSFIQYLQNQGQYQNAIIALDEIPVMALISGQRDSVNYLKGWSYYNIKPLDSSSFYLLKMDTSFASYLKSMFFGAYNNIYMLHYAKAEAILKGLDPLDPINEETKYFEQAGLALLKKDCDSFDTLSSKFSYDFYALTAQ